MNGYRLEIQRLPLLWRWATELDDKNLFRRLGSRLADGPLLIVGSGGSYAACAFAARLHQEVTGWPAMALTPLEYVRSPNMKASVLLISASGRNPDIHAAARHALHAETGKVAALCLRPQSPLVELMQAVDPEAIFHAEPPAGKDGFLATGSLLATAVMLCRSWGIALPSTNLPAFDDSPGSDEFDARPELLARRSIIALCSGWGGTAGLDLESRWGEAGLGSVTVLDPRNFAHGRHQGLARLAADSAVLALETAGDAEVLNATISLLPTEIPSARLRSPLEGPWGAIDLLVRTMRLAGKAAEARGFDPARPGVPEFGRKLYHQKLPRSITRGERNGSELFLQRKLTRALWAKADADQRQHWYRRFDEWKRTFLLGRFGGVVFDYDGTLCGAAHRRDRLPSHMSDRLQALLKAGLRVGVATGRGGSVLDRLREALPKELWSEVVVGLYNGGLVFGLGEDIPVPTPDTNLERVVEVLARSGLKDDGYEIAARPVQITVEGGRLGADLREVRRHVAQVLWDAGFQGSGLQLVASGHSVDIIPPSSSKLRVVEAVAARLQHPAFDVLRVGDQGDVGGNDHELLADRYGLSVDRVSPSLWGCWNVAPLGLSGPMALIRYLDALTPEATGGFSFDLEALR